MLLRVFAVTFVLFGASGTAFAYPYLGTGIPDDYDYQCTDCHVSTGGGTGCSSGWPCFNGFGRLYRQNGFNGTVVTGNVDSDGQNNNDELNGGASSAGFHSSAEAAGCNMEACAENGSFNCNNGVRCNASHGDFLFTRTDTERTYNYWTFTFDCQPGYGRGTTSGTGAWGCCTGGFEWNGSSCVNINECSRNTDDCHSAATCIDRSPGFDCDCADGYGGDGHGTFGCTMCAAGTVNVGTMCVDFDECASGPCGPGTCTQTPLPFVSPGYTCACNAGYESNGTTCVDIDECARGTDDCTDAPAGICENSIGSFSCRCNTPAFVGATGRDCVDYDECMDTVYASLCSSAATCVNGFGTWDCVCNPGFEGDGRVCVDIDECMRDLDDCHLNATCTNSIGAFSCACNSGYEGSGVFCSDINECADGTDGCALHEVCVNQIGMTNTCICEPGYSGDPCAVVCGDGLRGPGEVCDDANVADGDGCSAGCDVEEGWVCFDGPTGSFCNETCGDGLVDVDEECDDGSANSDTAVDACRTTCVRAFCGDGVEDTGEECDLGDNNSDDASDGCRTTCHDPYCGDGVVDTGELCDPGGGVPGAALSDSCEALCAPDAGIDPNDPPVLTGGACSAAPSRGGSVAYLLALALLFVRRRAR
jgi:cysteine-rich repeat protein